MSSLVWIAWLMAGLVALVSPVVLNQVLARVGVVDVPSERSSHSRPTLRGGGVAQLLAVAVGGIVGLSSVAGSDRSLLTVVLIGACLVGLLGLVEDVRGVPILARAGTQVAVGAACAASAVLITSASWWWLPLAAVAFAAYVNFVNFMDGINGITSLHGLIVGLCFAGLGIITAAPWLLVSGGLMAAAFVSFLPWNLTPPGVFLGDVGSYLLGGGVAAMAIVAVITGVPLVAVIAPLTIYLVDTVTTLVGRIFRGETWFAPHRRHIYQQLVDGGLSHVGVSFLVAGLTIGTGLVGLASAGGILAMAWTGWSIIVFLSVIYFSLPRLLLNLMKRGG